eukprot:352409-Chlamydomonas_euryale.AAC.7
MLLHAEAALGRAQRVFDLRSAPSREISRSWRADPAAEGSAWRSPGWGDCRGSWAGAGDPVWGRRVWTGGGANLVAIGAGSPLSLIARSQNESPPPRQLN